jgi:ubiquinol-cytochrome c reductase cytochrome b subunit
MQPAQEAAPAGYWERRTGWKRLKQLLFLEPLPGGSRWAAAFGSLLLFAFVLQVITGILLAMNYAPSVETAYPSVKYIQEEVFLGDFIRAMHHWGSSAMVILLLLHLVQVFVWGAYKPPREFTWMAGVLLLACTLGLAFTGYLLPWDQKAYWATKVGLGIVSTTPLIGDGLRELMQGGPEMGNVTLTRFFTIHGFVLPGLLILLLVIHLYLFRLHGVTPPWWQSERQLKAAEEPFWPKQALKDGIFALVFLATLGLWSWHNAAPLEPPADPSQPYEARPEWYFMFLFQLLRYFEGPFEIVGTFVLPTLFFLVLLFWPFLDRNPHRDPRKRPTAMTLLGLGVAGLVGLTTYANVTDVRMVEPELAKAPAAPPEAKGKILWPEVVKVYNSKCAGCHGINGVPDAKISANLPDFTSLLWQTSRADVEIAHTIQDGKGPLMPAYRDELAEKQILALTVYVRAFAGLPGEPAPVKPKQPPPAQLLIGHTEQIYRNFCLACHDANGTGASMRSRGMKDIPDFTDPKVWAPDGIDQKFRQSILKGTGQGKFMAAMEDKLAPADADQLVALLRKFQAKTVVKVEPEPPILPPVKDPAVVPTDPKKPPTLSPEQAARLRVAAGYYRQYCLVCHGSDGKGSDMKASMPTISDFTSRAWQDNLNNTQMKIAILSGKPGTLMPGFSDRLTDDQGQDLVAYIRAFGPRPKPFPEPDTDFEKRFRELQQQWEELHKQFKEMKRPPGKAGLDRGGLSLAWDSDERTLGLTACSCSSDAFDGGRSRSSFTDALKLSRLGEGPSPWPKAFTASPFQRASCGDTPGGGCPGVVSLTKPGRGPPGKSRPGLSGCCRISSIFCEKKKRVGDGASRCPGGGTSCQRRRNSMRAACSLPVRSATTRMWAAAVL